MGDIALEWASENRLGTVSERDSMGVRPGAFDRSPPTEFVKDCAGADTINRPPTTWVSAQAQQSVLRRALRKCGKDRAPGLRYRSSSSRRLPGRADWKIRGAGVKLRHYCTNSTNSVLPGPNVTSSSLGFSTIAPARHFAAETHFINGFNRTWATMCESTSAG